MKVLISTLLSISFFSSAAQTEVYSNEQITVTYENILFNEGKNNTQYNCIQTVSNKTDKDLYYQNADGNGFIELKIMNAAGWNASLYLQLNETPYTTDNGAYSIRALKAGETFSKENFFKVPNGETPQIKAYPSKNLKELWAFKLDINAAVMNGQWSSSNGQMMLLTYSLEAIQTDINSKVNNWALSSNNDVTSIYSCSQLPNARLLINKSTQSISLETGAGINVSFKK
jgi:hypothetical protein